MWAALALPWLTSHLVLGQPDPAGSSGNATNVAAGKRVGVEQVGLYDETQARGFDLTQTSAYRIDERTSRQQRDFPHDHR